MNKNPHLLVMKISYVPGMANEIFVWLDPDAAAGEAHQNSPTTFVGRAKGDYSFDRFILRGGGNNPFDFGEIRFGTTWNSVLPPNVSPDRFPKHDFKAWPAIIAAALGTNSAGGLCRRHSVNGFCDYE